MNCLECEKPFTPDNPFSCKGRHKNCYSRWLYRVSVNRRLSLRKSQRKYLIKYSKTERCRLAHKKYQATHREQLNQKARERWAANPEYWRERQNQYHIRTHLKEKYL